MPFTNLSRQPADAWIGGGIAETVSADLTAAGRRVVEQTAVLSALGTRGAADRRRVVVDPVDDIQGTVARELGATLLVQGTYQRVGEQLRITAQVVDMRSGDVLHRAKVDGSLSDVFEAQDRIASALVEQLVASPDRAPVTPADERRAALRGGVLVPADTTGRLVLPPPDAGVGSAAGPAPGGRGGGGFEVTGRGPMAIAVRTSQPPAIDGRLDDPVWRDVTPITQFVQTSPVEGAPASEATEVWIAYDSDHVYLAFYAHYTDPGIIRANRAERDSGGGDDQMSVLFDPFLDQQRAYMFTVNGYGVAGDSIVNAGGSSGRSRSSVGRSSSGSSSGGGSSSSGGGGVGPGSSGFGIRGDRSWNALFDVRGGLVDDGWTAEMAIPFKSLRYPSRSTGQPHRWGMQITRNIRDKSESLVWSPVSRDIAGQLTQMGVLEGLIDLSTSRNLEILPTFTGVQTGALSTTDGSFQEGGPIGQMGVGVKYGVTSNLTLDFTYNPDFSQIESDRPQVEVNQRFALFYPEQRPFFLEGQEIFAAATPLSLVHTRTVVDPRFGAKLTGKTGKMTLGVFVADDEAPGRLDDTSDPAYGRTAQSLIGRVRYDLYAESYLGVIATAREFGEDYNHVGGVDGRFRLGATHNVSFLAVASEHQDETVGRLSGPVFEVDFRRQARNLSYAVSHSSIDPDFRTATGFVPRVDIRRTDANMAYKWWPEGTLISWGPSVSYLRNHNHTGELEDEQFRANVDLEFVRNLRFSGGLSRELERFGGVNFRKTGFSFFGLLSGRLMSVIVSANGGDGVFFSDTPFLGRSTNGNVALYVRPTSRLRTELRVISSRFVDPTNDTEVFDVKIYRWRATYQFTDRLLLRHILEHNTLSGTLGNNLLLTYRINTGTVAFLGYDDRYQQGFQIDEGFFPTTGLERTNRAFFTKISYLFRY